MYKGKIFYEKKKYCKNILDDCGYNDCSQYDFWLVVAILMIVLSMIFGWSLRF